MDTKKEITLQLQKKLKTVRQLMELSTQELADFIGVTRQTVNNLESGKSPLSETQVIALLAVIDRRFHSDSAEFHKIQKMLGLDAYSSTQKPIQAESALDIWFRINGLKCKDYNPNTLEEGMPMKEIAICDSTQLMIDSSIIPRLAEKKAEIIIPVSTPKELDRLLNNNILDEVVTKRIIEAKKTLKIYEKNICFWKAKGHTDSAILQLIELKMSDPSILSINVYTFDKMLTKDCLSYNRQRTAKHHCTVNVLQYQNQTETPSTNSSISYPKKLVQLECAMWRNNIYLPDFNANDSLCEENAPIPTLSGNEVVTKYWAWYVRAKDIYRIYQKIRLYQGETASVNVISFDNQCDVYVRLMAYCEADCSEHYSEPVSLDGATWKTLTLNIPKNCDYINIEFLPTKDSVFNGEFNGMDGFIDLFQITR